MLVSYRTLYIGLGGESCDGLVGSWHSLDASTWTQVRTIDLQTFFTVNMIARVFVWFENIDVF